MVLTAIFTQNLLLTVRGSVDSTPLHNALLQRFNSNAIRRRQFLSFNKQQSLRPFQLVNLEHFCKPVKDYKRNQTSSRCLSISKRCWFSAFLASNPTLSFSFRAFSSATLCSILLSSSSETFCAEYLKGFSLFATGLEMKLNLMNKSDNNVTLRCQGFIMWGHLSPSLAPTLLSQLTINRINFRRKTAAELESRSVIPQNQSSNKND